METGQPRRGQTRDEKDRVRRSQSENRSGAGQGPARRRTAGSHAAGTGTVRNRERHAAAERTPERRKPGSRSARVRDELRERKKRVLRQRLAVGAAAAAFLVIVYCMIAARYARVFLPNTYINGFEAGGFSAADTEALLRNSVEKYQLEVAFRGGKCEEIKGSDIDLTYVSSNEVSELLKAQNRMGWLFSLLGRKASGHVKTSFRFDEDKLKHFLEALPEFDSGSVTKPRNARIVLMSDQTYRVADAVEGNEPDQDVIFRAVSDAISASESRLSLNNVSGAYKKPQVTAEDEDLKARAEDLNNYVSTVITLRYPDGTDTEIGRDQLVSWIGKDEDGNYAVDADTVYTAVYKIVKAAAEKFDHVQNTIDFQTTAEGTVNEFCSPYGYRIDKQGMTEKIYSDLYARKSGEIELENSVSGDMDPTFGGTYIEVDVTGQHLYYYRDGKLALDSDVVTGLESDRDRLTPSGVFAVFAKKQDQTLGSLEITGYASHVDYWMPFYESYGMHDAGWRSSFGGDIYLTSGSHGCVNLPPDFAAELFEAIDNRTPVIVCRKGDNAAEGKTDGVAKFD